jgi:phospholipid transport system substrate-binding protein
VLVLARRLAPLLLLLLFSQSLQAAEHPARQMVEETTNKVLERLRSERDKLQADNNLIYPLVEELILPHFDFHRMSIWVLGKNWRQASAEEQQIFTREFQKLLVRTYATALLEYTDQKIEYLPFHASPGDKRVTVRTQIVQSGGVNIPLNYSLYLDHQGQWKVYDISVDGVSLVTNFRSSFATEISRGGIKGLLAKLDDMNRKKGGTDGK